MSNRDESCTHVHNRGFTLLELSVVLVLIGMILGGGLVVLTASVQTKAFNVTVARMDAIEKALLNYSASFKRLPCPANLSLPPSDVNYGVESAVKGTCTGGSPAASFAAASGTVEGAVPTRALQLPDSYMYDGWGNRFSYAVDPSYTADAALPITAGGVCSASPSSITVNDATGAARTTVGIYALISHGANGHGAYTSHGAAVNSGSVNADELTNCHCSSSGVAGVYVPTYVQKVPTQDASNGLNNFDDIVTFKEAWQMQGQNFPLAASAACPDPIVYIYVANNWPNDGIVKYDKDGNALWSTDWNLSNPQGIGITSSGALWVSDYYNDSMMLWNPDGSWGGWFQTAWWAGTGTAIDPTGNTFVVDSANNRVVKYDTSSGAFWGSATLLSQFGTGGSGDGQFSWPWGIAIDTTGNIWVTDAGNNRVEKFDGNGNFILKFGTLGSGNGQFSDPQGIATDSTGNVYVADVNNCRIEKFSSSGTFIRSIGTCGSGNGQLNFPWALALDSAGNIFVLDRNNSRVEKFDKNGNYKSQFSNPGGYGAIAIGTQ